METEAWGVAVGQGEAGVQGLPLGVEGRVESKELDSVWTSAGDMSSEGPSGRSSWSRCSLREGVDCATPPSDVQGKVGGITFS